MKKLLLIALSFVFIGLLGGCYGQEFGGYSSEDFELLEHWNDIYDVGTEEPVLVYIYDRDFLGTYNVGSREANEHVFPFGAENELGLELYLINQRDAQGTRPIDMDIHPRNPTQLLLVYDGRTERSEEGATHVINFIEELEEGDYTPPGMEEEQDSE